MSHAPATPPPPSGPSEVKPYIPAEQSPAEMTVAALVTGSILGIIFAASSVYLGLKVGLTVSASIPIAVLSITIFKALSRGTGPRILINNIVQTTGSAGESIAAGVAFTLPSLLLMGFDMEFGRILLVALFGGILGVLMMIPLRQGLIVKEHGKLTYPEGTACAQVLIVGEQGGTNAKTVFQGFGIGMLHAALMGVMGMWKDTAAYVIKSATLRHGSIAVEATAPMLGVGYIIGLRTGAIMMAGGMLSFLILVPLIFHFGSGIPTPFGPGVTKTIAQMSPGEIRNNYLLYIGAGAVATGGFISLARSLPTIIQAFRRGLSNIGVAQQSVKRTDQDMSMKVVIFGSLALIIAIAVAPILDIKPFSAVLIVLFGFFFVTVSSRITGEIGSSSNPISGMTVATLLITCLLFVAMGWVGVSYKAMALTTAALVCVAASNGGTISQDLKTGFLVGGTPRRQQMAILVGVMTSALAIGWTLQKLNEWNQTIAPKANVYAGYTVDPKEDLAAAPTQVHEGKTYRVHFINKVDLADKNLPPRGRYLVDEKTRKIAFLVDPGVCGKEKFALAPVDADAPTFAALTQSGNKKDPITVDDKSYESYEDTKSGRLYLVDPTTKTLIHSATTVEKYDAPKAQLFALVIDGIIGGDLPWTLVLIGVFIAVMLELCGVAALPFAVGVYLPISTSTPIFIGGLIRWFVDRKTKVEGAEAEFSSGTLLASGLIAGGSIGGVVAAFIGAKMPETSKALAEISHKIVGDAQGEDWLPMIPFALMGAALVWVGTRVKSVSIAKN